MTTDDQLLLFLAGSLAGVALTILIALAPDALWSLRRIAAGLRRRDKSSR